MKRGFQLLEVTIAGGLLAVMFGAITGVMVKDQTTTRVLTAQVGPETGARRALRQIVAELKTASIRGEDRNNNNELDPYEDVNENFYFDAVWSLEDGTDDEAGIEFNRRLAVKDSAEDLTQGTTYSTKIAYFIANNRLVRSVSRVDPETSKIVEIAHVLQNNIVGLRFSRRGYVVTVSIDVLLPEGVYRTPLRTLTESVLLRN